MAMLPLDYRKAQDTIGHLLAAKSAHASGDHAALIEGVLNAKASSVAIGNTHGDLAAEDIQLAWEHVDLATIVKHEEYEMSMALLTDAVVPSIASSAITTEDAQQVQADLDVVAISGEALVAAPTVAALMEDEVLSTMDPLRNESASILDGIDATLDSPELSSSGSFQIQLDLHKWSLRQQPIGKVTDAVNNNVDTLLKAQ